MKIKKILIVILSLMIMEAACFVAVKTLDAQESQPSLVEEEIEVIDAEVLGIETKIQEENTDNTQEEEEKEIIENQKECYAETETVEVIEEEEEEGNICPENMHEGYEEGTYFEPNCFDCELHEYCYMCEEHEFESEYFWDEDINPRYGWVYSETCIVCGHGTCKPVKEIEE